MKLIERLSVIYGRKVQFSVQDFEEALAHSSYANEEGLPSNERLEFLGDSILGLETAKFLFKLHGDSAEGSLSKEKSKIVSDANLINVYNALELEKEFKVHGRPSEKMKASLVEAIIAAVYLKLGEQQSSRTRAGVYKFIYDVLFRDYLAGRNIIVDVKTELQELLQKKRPFKIEYKVSAKSRKVFLAEVFNNGKKLGEGTGSSKQQAEKDAAAKILQILKQSPPPALRTGKNNAKKGK